MNLNPACAAYTAKELAVQLKDAGAKALVTQAVMLDTALEAARIAGISGDRILLLGEGSGKDPRFKHFTSLRSATPGRVARTRCGPNDLAVLVYSSGTTGPPKGVILTHRNLCINILQIVQAEAHEVKWDGQSDGKGDRVLGILPFFHIYGNAYRQRRGLVTADR